MKIGIIVAMYKEMKKYFSIYDFKLIDTKFKIYKANYLDKEIYLCLCGIGKVNSAILTEYLIEHYEINFIINSGCCGSLVENINILDTIIVESICYHDFSPIRIMEEVVPDDGKMKVNKKYVNLIEEILKNNNIPYYIGGITSGDCFVTESDIKNEIHNKTNCIAVDMESASISHTCKLNDIDFCIIRSISDFADGTVEQEEKAANQAVNVVKEIINKI